jgi:hypothetical protein
MENVILSKYERLFDSLSLELKIELLSRLTESIKNSLPTKEKSNKEELLHELYGSWSEMGEDLTKVIYDSRTISDREINLD